MEIEQKVIEIIANQISAKSSEIAPGAILLDDLGMDSLDRIELAMAIEKEFNFEISDEEAVKLLTVQQIIDYVKEKKNI